MSASPKSADMIVRGTSLGPVSNILEWVGLDGLTVQTYIRMQRTNSMMDLGELLVDNRWFTDTYQASHTAGIASNTQTFHQMTVFVF